MYTCMHTEVHIHVHVHVHVQVYMQITPYYIPNPFIAVRRVEASFSALKFLLGFKVPSVRGNY